MSAVAATGETKSIQYPPRSNAHSASGTPSTNEPATHTSVPASGRSVTSTRPASSTTAPLITRSWSQSVGRMNRRVVSMWATLACTSTPAITPCGVR